MILNQMILAHILSGNSGGFLVGLEHPVLGFDHFLAMVSVGIVSTQLGKKAIWLVPSTFVAIMLIGGIWGILGLPFGFVEAGIAVSVFALGVAICEGKNLKIGFTLIFTGIFGFFHGYAHGIEMPIISQPLFYALGFILGTILLHILGVLIGLFAEKIPERKDFLRLVGAGIAGIGIHLIIQL